MIRCRVCGEAIEFADGAWVHVHSEWPECRTGDGAVAAPDEEYDSDHDRRVCAQCGYLAIGGPTSTAWEMHDHKNAEHPTVTAGGG